MVERLVEITMSGIKPNLLSIIFEHLIDIGFDSVNMLMSDDQVNINLGGCRIIITNNIPNHVSVGYYHQHSASHNNKVLNPLDPTFMSDIIKEIFSVMLKAKADLFSDIQTTQLHIKSINDLCIRILNGKNIDLHGGTSEVGEINVGKGTV
jgi:hypothetical protein